MKRIKLAIITFLCLFVVVLGSCKVLAHEKPTGVYPDCLEVIEVNRFQDVVYGKNCAGLIYSFYGCEDYMTGDLVAVIMDENGTPETVLDDKIIDCRYAGYIDR